MTQKLTSRGKLLSRMKQSGYDATERQSYWKAEQEKLKAEHEKLTKDIEARKLKEDTPAHDEFKRAIGLGSYGDFVKKHGVAKTQSVVSSLKKERDTLRSHKQDWAGPKHVQHHDFAIRGLQRAMGEDVGMVGGSPVNNVGDGEIAGMGVGKQGEPGVSLRNKKKVVPFAVFIRKPQDK